MIPKGGMDWQPLRPFILCGSCDLCGQIYTYTFSWFGFIAIGLLLEQKAREQGCSRYHGMSVVGRDERPRSSAWAIGDDRSFVMGPHSQYVDGLFLFKDFVYQTVLDVDSPRVAPLQVAFE